MRFNRVCFIAALAGPLAACATPSEEYPSLAIRDVERAAAMPPAPPVAYVPPAPPAATLERVDQLAGEAASAHRTFLAEAPRVRNTVAAARGAEPGAESWSVAQVAVAGLQASRSKAMIALADIDRIYVDAALEGLALERIALARDQVQTQVEEQDATIGTMLGSLR